MTLGKYKCVQCGLVWEEPHRVVVCPTCGHKYVVWINYEEMKKKNFK